MSVETFPPPDKFSDPRPEHQELTLEQKRALGLAWAEMVVDTEVIPERIETMDQKEIKKWLFDTMMNDIEKLGNEWGLHGDEQMIEKIKKAESPEGKAAAELEYIQNVHAQVDALVQRFERSPEKSNKWESWPKLMRETREFNCVGATLLGMLLVGKGGIQSFYGNPHGHVVNIAKLANGEWWYIDFMNGKRNVINIHPEIIFLKGIAVLKIQEPDLGYQLIPLYDNAAAAGSVLGNLSSLQHAAAGGNPEEPVAEREAKVYVKRYEQLFRSMDFSLLCESLYPEPTRVDETAAMKEEIARLDAANDLEIPLRNYSKTLTVERQRALVKEIQNEKDAIIALLYYQDETVLSRASTELKRLLELLLEKLKGIKERQPEAHQEAIDKIVGRIRNI